MVAFPNIPGVLIGTGTGASIQTTSGASVVVQMPFTQDGHKPARVRLSLSSGAAFVRIGTAATSLTAVTSDTIVTAYEALVLPTLGRNAIAALSAGANAGKDGVLQIAALEDGVVIPSPTAIG